MNNRKGFTLVELLVVMVIMGIIIGLSFPAIRKLQEKNMEKKFTTYQDSLKMSAKLYTDSYEEDLFGRKENGCACISFSELKDKKLAKDITVKDVTCDTDNTFVRITKIADAYTYVSYVGCKEKDNKVDIIYPKQDKAHTMASAGCDTLCNEEVSNGIYVKVDPEKATTYAKKHTTHLVIESITGINQGIEIFYAWSTSSTNSASITDYKRARITAPANQKETIEMYGSVKTTSTSINTPSKKSGSYYLHIRVDKLYDLYDSYWKQADGSNYIVAGPFNIDNEPPVVNSYSVKSIKDNYNSTNPILNIDATDNITKKENIEFCLSVEKNKNNYFMFHKNGGKTSDYTSNDHLCSPDLLDKNSNRLKYYGKITKDMTPPAITPYQNKEISYPIYFNVVDEVGNSTQIKTTYKTSPQYTLEYDSGKGSKCDDKKVIKKNSGTTTWGTLCTPTRDHYTFKGWYTTNDIQITKDTEATSDLKVEAKWELNKYTIKLNKGTGIKSAKLNGSTTLTQKIAYGSDYKFEVVSVDDYYRFSKWTNEDGSSAGTTKEITGTVTGDITLTANAVTNKLQLIYHTNGGTLAKTRGQICPEPINCGSVCERTTNLSGCSGNATGKVFTSSAVAYDNTGYSTSGVRDHHGDGTITMERAGYTPNKYWRVGSTTSDLIIDETIPYATVKDLAVALGKGEEFKTGDVTINLYACWSAKILTFTLDNQSATSAGTSYVYLKYKTGWYEDSSASTSLTSITIPKKEYANAYYVDYKFHGYFTEKNGQGTKVINANGTPVSDLLSSFTSDTTLYAYWKKEGWEFSNRSEWQANKWDVDKQEWRYYENGNAVIGWRYLCPNNKPSCEKKSWWYFDNTTKAAVVYWKKLCTDPSKTSCKDDEKRWYYFEPTDPDGNGYLNANMLSNTTRYFDNGKCSHFKSDGSCCDGTVNGVTCSNSCEHSC